MSNKAVWVVVVILVLVGLYYWSKPASAPVEPAPEALPAETVVPLEAAPVEVAPEAAPVQ